MSAASAVWLLLLKLSVTRFRTCRVVVCKAPVVLHQEMGPLDNNGEHLNPELIYVPNSMQHPPSAFRSDSKMVAAWWLESVHVVTSNKWADFRLNNSDFDSLVSHASPFDERDPNSPQRMKKESLLMLCPREIEQPENRTVAKSNDLLSTKTAGLFRFLSFPTNLYKSFHSNTFSNFSESAEIGVASSLRLSSQKQALEAIFNKHFSRRSQGQAIFKHLSGRSQGPFLVTREDNACTAHDCIQVFHIFPQCSGRLVQLEMLSLNPGKSWGMEWGNNLEVNSARHLLWRWKVKIRRISTSPTGLCHPTMGMLKGTAAISLLLATHDPELSKPFKEYASNTWNDWDTNSICTVALKGTSRSKKNRKPAHLTLISYKLLSIARMGIQKNTINQCPLESCPFDLKSLASPSCFRCRQLSPSWHGERNALHTI